MSEQDRVLGVDLDQFIAAVEVEPIGAATVAAAARFEDTRAVRLLGVRGVRRGMTVGKVVLSGSVSLDGYSAGPNVGDDHPLGEGGERLHRWLFAEGADRDAGFAASVGAVVLGRRTFDVGLRFWQDTPYPVPSFVLTHDERPPLAMASAAFTFVGDGPESAIDQARAAAGERDVLVMAGAESAQHVLRAGLVDEIRLQLVPVLLGGGARLLDGLRPTELERVEAVEAGDVVHLRFRVLR